MGGVDIQLLGLGHNGHIGFNEPDSSFRTDHTLRGSDREHHRGEQEILRISRRCSASGIYDGDRNDHESKEDPPDRKREAKADIVAKAFFGPVTPEVPASILQLHPDVVIVADKAALSKVPKQA